MSSIISSIVQQSVRHHLSLNRLFERRPRPETDPGFGSYWTVNLTAPPGTKRPRKRGRPNKDSVNGIQMPPKKRGRPPKAALPVEDPQSSHQTYENEEAINLLAGPSDIPRPRLIRPGEEHVDYRAQPEDPGNDFSSDDDSDTEDESPVHPMDRRESLVGLSAFGPSRSHPFTLPPFSSLQDGSDHVIESLQAEIESLRRQSAEAATLSLRLSEQLVQAQAESSRTRATLRTIEDETKRRRGAELLADSEEKRRRKVEETLHSLLSQTRPP
jgi:hypothetical protein